MANPTGRIKYVEKENMAGVMENAQIISKADAIGLGADGYYKSVVRAAAVVAPFTGMQLAFTEYAGSLAGSTSVVGGITYGKKVTFTPSGTLIGTQVTGATRAHVGKAVYVGGNTGSQTYTVTSATDVVEFGILAEFRGATDCDVKYGGGVLSAAAVAANYVLNTYTATGTIATGDDLAMVDSALGAVTMTLPPAANVLKPLMVKAIDLTAAIIIDGNAAETIDGALTYTFAVVDESITLISDGTNWRIV